MKCKECGSEHNILEVNKPHIGLYCKSCGKWFKWVGKKEFNILSKYTEVIEIDN